MTFPVAPAALPTLTAEQARAVWREGAEHGGPGGDALARRAASAVATVARERFLDGDAAGRHVTVLAGRGDNGTAGLAAAAALHEAGARVMVILSRAPEGYEGLARAWLQRVRGLGIETYECDPMLLYPETALIVDGLIGCGLEGEVRRIPGELIAVASTNETPVLSIDVPSGIDATTGEPRGEAMAAQATVTLGLPKAGLAPARAHTGELYLADVGIPPGVYRALTGLDVAADLFAGGPILRVA